MYFDLSAIAQSIAVTIGVQGVGIRRNFFTIIKAVIIAISVVRIGAGCVDIGDVRYLFTIGVSAVSIVA